MAQALDRNRPLAPGVAFELERLALADGRLELSGRWRGVRGRRFVRPTLTVDNAGERRRLLAELEHKPWAPEREPWRAAFPWERELEDVDAAELAVAPDIAIALPLPSRRRPRGPSSPATVARSDHERVRVELERLRDSRRTLEQERSHLGDELELARAQCASAEESRKREVAAREELIAEREALCAERDGLAAEREHLIAERDALAAEREHLIAERDALRAERDGLAAEREHLIAERDHLIAERDALSAERQELIVRESEAEARREQLAARCRELQAEREGALAARDDALAARGAALVMHNARAAANPGSQPSWLVRIAAVALLLGVLIAALAAVHAL
jgi:hypothetical protein